jgi:peptidoglycan hydrolase-like protein with peptidoglycan-binding domain
VLAALALGEGGAAAAAPPAPSTAASPLVGRWAVDLATALVLAGHPVPVGAAWGARAARMAGALGRRGRAGLVRVYALPRLRLGARGRPVLLLQARLDGLGSRLALDGVFGPATLAAVRAFAHRQGLGAPATVDARVWRRLLGQPLAGEGRSAWALASLGATTPAALAAWNPFLGGRAAWGRPIRGTVWILPPDVRPDDARTLGNGRWTAAAVSRPTPASSPPVRAAEAVLALDVLPPVSDAGLRRLAAALAGRGVAATVLLPAAALGGAGAAALALEGEDVGVRLVPPMGAGALARALALAAQRTGSRPVLAYAGPYPAAAVAALAARAGLALLVGTRSLGRHGAVAPGGVYVVSGSPRALLAALPADLARWRRAGAAVESAAAALRLHPAAP